LNQQRAPQHWKSSLGTAVRPRRATTSSHAERQLMNWFEDRLALWKRQCANRARSGSGPACLLSLRSRSERLADSLSRNHVHLGVQTRRRRPRISKLRWRETRSYLINGLPQSDSLRRPDRSTLGDCSGVTLTLSRRAFRRRRLSDRRTWAFVDSGNHANLAAERCVVSGRIVLADEDVSDLSTGWLVARNRGHQLLVDLSSVVHTVAVRLRSP
jgi:hypothetical protein